MHTILLKKNNKTGALILYVLKVKQLYTFSILILLHFQYIDAVPIQCLHVGVLRVQCMAGNKMETVSHVTWLMQSIIQCLWLSVRSAGR